MNMLSSIPAWVWPCAGGILIGVGYASTFSLGLFPAIAAADSISGAQKISLSEDEIKVLVAKSVAKQAYRTVTISFLRFALSAALLVWVGQATATITSNTVVQTGLATLGLVLGLLISLVVMACKARRVK